MRLFLALAALLIASVGPASAQFRAVRVDASPIAESGYPTFAHRVEAAVAPAVASIFADKINPSDPRGLTLVVRILSVNLPTATYSGGESENDYMVSEGFVVDPRGRVIASTLVRSPVMAWTTVASLPVEVEEHRRMRNLGLHAAGFIRKRLDNF